MYTLFYTLVMDILRQPPSPYVSSSAYDSHGCCVSCGYTYCESLHICVRLWETYCKSLDNGH